MIRAQELFRAFRANPRQTLVDIREALDRRRSNQVGGVAPDDFSIRDLAAHFIVDSHGEPIGLSALESLCRTDRILESDAALTTSAFAVITRQLLNTAVGEGHQLPSFILSAAVPTLRGNREQTRVVDVSLPLKEGKSVEVEEGQEFPLVGMYGEYAKTPITKKRGAIVAITKEAVLADDTGQILDRARRVGELIGLEKEIALTDYVVGAISDSVTEKRVGDSAEVTKNLFYDSGDSERWTNEQVNALVDWTDIDVAEHLFLGITMPGSGHPPVLTQRTVLTPPQLRSTASRILNATETRSTETGDSISNTVAAANPIRDLGLRHLVSALVYTRMVAAGIDEDEAAGTWFYGDLQRAFRYYENWALTVEEDRTREATFTHDILVRFKASERGTPVIVDPRYWSKQVPSQEAT